MSPFLAAHKIKEPLLLIHGEADNNPGTFPLQSERMYQAIRGNGGTVRLVMLPYESHGYAARESVEHVLAETLGWFDRHVRTTRRRSRRTPLCDTTVTEDLPAYTSAGRSSAFSRMSWHEEVHLAEANSRTLCSSRIFCTTPRLSAFFDREHPHDH